jgi:hypothetical protein
MLVRLPARVTIPIDNRPCFSHRFSPKGFNLNASEISLPLPDPSALAFRLKPILTVQSYVELNSLSLEESRFYSAVNSTFLGRAVRDKSSPPKRGGH